MKYMVAWRIPPENYTTAMSAFLQGGAPMSEGLTAIGRWHAPGSHRGWLLCETADSGSLYEHIAHWAHLLETEVTPVVDDEEAATAASRVHG